MNPNLKRIIFCMINSLFFTAGFAQKKDTAQLSVHYTFRHIRDTLHREKIYTEDMVLYAGKNSSMYDSHDRVVQDSLLHASVQVTYQDNGTPVYSSRPAPAQRQQPVTIATIYRYDGENKAFVGQHYLGYQYLAEIEFPKIDWEILTEKKIIKGISCQKAKGDCLGRTYEAWFAPAIGLHSGPWKLAGLPGLIIEATDSKQEVSFIFEGMTNLQNKSILIEPSAVHLVHTTKEEFTKLYEITTNDRAAAFALVTGGTGTLRNMNQTPAPASKPVSTTNPFNNPVELPIK
jgi:GLPGLI family protein